MIDWNKLEISEMSQYDMKEEEMLSQSELQVWANEVVEGYDLNDGDVFTVDEWKSMVDYGCLIDYDGFGRMVLFTNNNYFMGEEIIPSQVAFIPPSCTHIVWYNR